VAVGLQLPGLINTGSDERLARWSMPRPGSISIFSQSGALCTAILDHASERGFGLAKLVSIGNKADLSEVDLLTALGDDPRRRSSSATSRASPPATPSWSRRGGRAKSLWS
jgi:acetyltransferase